MLLVEPPSASRTREGGKKRARPEGKTTPQRKGTRSKEVARNFGDGERFDLIIADKSKSEQVRPSSSRSLLTGEWEIGLVVEWAWCGGRFDWLIRWQ